MQEKMINLTPEQIDCALPRVENGLKQYISLQDDLRNFDVSKNRDYQRRFNHFYRVRRGTEWQSYFYKLLQDKKNTETGFAEILNAIYEKTDRYESSFASKLVATIDPNKPVIDKFVLANVGLALPYAAAKNRQERILLTYENLTVQFEIFLNNSENGRYLVNRFREQFPKYSVTEIKMVDFVLWQTREIA